MVSYTQYMDPTDTTRTPSPIIWADCPWLEALHNPACGIGVWDDFLDGQIVDQSDSYLSYGQWNVSSSTGVTFNPIIDGDHGVAQVAGNDADEDGIVIWKEGFARFGTGQLDKVWFEARFQVPSVADSTQGFALGFVETTVRPTSVITLVDNTCEPNASEDFIGLLQVDADGNVLEATYQEGGQTRVNVGDLLTIVASTNYKVGLTYEGGAGTKGLGVVKYYLNGALTQTYDVLSTDNFPDANHLGCMFAHKTTATGAVTFNLDWIRAFAVGGNT